MCATAAQYLRRVGKLSRSDAQSAARAYGRSSLLGALVARYPVASIVEGVELASVASSQRGQREKTKPAVGGTRRAVPVKSGSFR